MRLILPVQKTKIVNQVCELVDKTSTSLVVTMDLSDTVLPKTYELALKRAQKREVKIIRYCFGSEKKFKILVEEQKDKIKHVLVGKAHQFQRFLISDKERMFFKIGDQFMYTKESLIIKALLNYIKNLKIYRQNKVA